MNPGKLNILEHWKRHFDALSSPLAIRPTLERKWVNYIPSMLLNIWEDDFFYLDIFEAIEKNQLHFIHSLIYKFDKASFYRALEVCLLIDYAKSRNPEQYEKLKSVKGMTERVRDVLCELLVEFAFLEAGFSYEAGPRRGRQILEGYAMVKNEQFLVECKNKYSMSEERFNVIRYFTARLSNIFKTIQPRLECVGCMEINQNRFYTQDLHKPIKRLEQFFSNPGSYHPQITIEENGVTIVIHPGTRENLLKFDQGELKADVRFAIRNTFELDPKANIIFRLQISHSQRSSRKKLSQKLLKTVKEAREQHLEEGCFGRIFCIFNEFYNDLRPPLLVNTENFVPDVENYLKDRSASDIVILVDRSFNLGLPKIQFFVIGHKSLSQYKDELAKKLDFSIYNKWPHAAAFLDS